MHFRRIMTIAVHKIALYDRALVYKDFAASSCIQGIAH